MGDAGAQVGFGIAKRATRAGFSAASRFFVKKPAAVLEEAVGPNIFSQSLRRVDSVLDAAHQGAQAGHELAHSLTTRTLQAAKAELDLRGAREGQLLQLAVGEEAAEALVMVHGVVQNFAGPLVDVPFPELLTAARAWAAAQRATAQLRGEGVAEDTQGPYDGTDTAELERWLRFSCATFGAECLGGMVQDMPGFIHAVATTRTLREHGATAGELALACAGLGGRLQVVEFQRSRRTLFEPGYLVCLDHDRTCVVVALRGTSSAADALADLVCEAEEVELGGFVGLAHGGMLRAARRLSDILAEYAEAGLETLAETGRRPSIVLCGHSLGAGVAALIAALWRDFGLFEGVDVRCFAFACPQVLDADLALAVSNHTTSVIVGADMVPRLSLATASDLREALLHIRTPSAYGLPESCSSASLLGAEARGDAQALAAAHEAIRRRACTSPRRLYPAGRLVFFPGGDDPGECRTINPEFIDELIISRDMAGAHMPPRYLAALQASSPA